MTVAPRIEDLLRELAPQVLGVVAHRFGDFDRAEDAVQEGLLAAARHWRDDGVPRDPLAWLITAAARRMTDQIRGDQARRRRERSVAALDTCPPETAARDDTLTLLVLCCHPALTPASAIALTLRAVGGLSTTEIARAFLVPDTTMAQRISRAKRGITRSGGSFRMPTAQEQAPRLRSVRHVLYLIFTEGHTSSTGPGLQRVDLSDEAIRLTRMLHRALPEDPETTGLLALMLLTDARRPARSGPAGELIPLAHQDRTRWDRRLIAEGAALVQDAISRRAVGEYQIQAAIAAVHDQAPRAQDTDWPQITALYGLLERMTDNPVVTLNRAVATAMSDTPAAGLAILDTLADRLAGHYRLDAARAHLLELAGDTDAAAEHYSTAAAHSTNLPEQHHLAAQAARLRATGAS